MGWMAEVGMEIFQENCLKEIDKKIDEAKQDYKRAPSLAKEQYIKGLVEARQTVATQSTYT